MGVPPSDLIAFWRPDHIGAAQLAQTFVDVHPLELSQLLPNLEEGPARPCSRRPIFIHQSHVKRWRGVLA